MQESIQVPAHRFQTKCSFPKMSKVLKGQCTTMSTFQSGNAAILSGMSIALEFDVLHLNQTAFHATKVIR